jgi:hypothetical protein
MKKTIRMIGAIVALALFLAGAAFVGGRLLNGQGLASSSSSNESGPSLSGPNGPISFDYQPAEELPQTPADVNGLFDHRQDNSLFIGTGMAVVGVDANGKVDSNSDGPAVEVIVTSQTTIYKDVTLRQYSGGPQSAGPQPGQKIQQVLEEGSLDDIGQASHITVWGKKTGDRFIADILVYSPPEIGGKPPAGQ